MKNLIQDIEGVKYILINDVVHDDIDLETEKDRCRKLGGIFQGIHDRQTDWFGDVKQIKFSVLLPFDKHSKW